MRGRIESSNSDRVRRISVWMPGRKIGIVASVSDDSASLARRHSSRSRASAASVAGSLASTCTPLRGDQRHHPAEEGLVEVDAAESLQALGLAERSNPSSVLRRIVASKVPPPKS